MGEVFLIDIFKDYLKGFIALMRDGQERKEEQDWVLQLLNMQCNSTGGRYQ